MNFSFTSTVNIISKKQLYVNACDLVLKRAIHFLSSSCSGSQGAGTYPSMQWARGGVHPHRLPVRANTHSGNSFTLTFTPTANLEFPVHQLTCVSVQGGHWSRHRGVTQSPHSTAALSLLINIVFGVCFWQYTFRK